MKVSAHLFLQLLDEFWVLFLQLVEEDYGVVDWRLAP